jgi:hypothetical protein
LFGIAKATTHVHQLNLHNLCVEHVKNNKTEERERISHHILRLDAMARLQREQWTTMGFEWPWLPQSPQG